MIFSQFDHECMALALRLARKGMFTTDPNPRVGCVIAGNQRIIGRGWHEYAGGPHAEIAALDDSDESTRGNTAYVTLEPCSHKGRTPPCSEALQRAGVSRVVVATGDPNPEVCGNGIEQLRAAGITVETGLMSAEAEALNPGFLKRMKQSRPWIRIKIAMSLDGRIALANGDSMWISSEESRRDVQDWRARSSAILTGIGTVMADNPSMNARVSCPVSQPLRIVLDSRWRVPLNSRILQDATSVTVVGGPEAGGYSALQANGVSCLQLPLRDEGVDLPELMQALARMELNEVQVEAGSRLCGALLREQLVDEILIYQAPILLGQGGFGPFTFGPLESMSERLHLDVLETTQIGNDLRIRLQPQRRD